jgi:hypothetical protein
MAKVFVGILPTADTIFTDGVDPVAIMVREANAALDRERAVAERARLAAVADAERGRKTRLARSRRRFTKALRSWLR